MTTYYSVTSFVTEGVLTDPTFAIPFDYIRNEDIFVYSGTTRLLLGDSAGAYRVVDGSVELTGVFPVGTRITIRRFTRRDSRLAEYFDGSTLTENDLNLMDRQLLFLIQELYDYLSISTGAGPTIPGGAGNPGPGGNNGDTTIIDTIIDSILNSQLFQDLIALIELTDINAELILQNALNIHNSWTQDRRIDGELVRGRVDLEQIDAKYENTTTVIINGQLAMVENIEALGAQFNDARADIVRIDTALATESTARATAIGLLQSQIGSAVGRIGTIEETYVDEDAANALIVSQLDARFTQENLDGFINAAQVVTGLTARANRTDASVSGITSYIAGSGVQVNPDGTINWGVPTQGSVAWSASQAQTWVVANANNVAASTQLLNSLSATYGEPANNPAAIVAALRQDYRTYADSESASASAVQTLQANRQPILFSAQPPNPFTDPQYAGTPFATNGFPRGTIWYEQSGRENTPYWYQPNIASVPGEVQFYVVRDGTSQIRGVWSRQRDSDQEELIRAIMGARIDSTQFVGVFEDRVEAAIEDKLITVYDAPDFNVVQAISQRMVSLVNEEDGLVYSAWNVRINQTLGGGTPVIAGIGLGMQADLTNPERGSLSDFIVMANRFSVIAPPSAGSFNPVTGQLNPGTVVVPFVIDTTSNTVMVNGTLLARSLVAVDGYVGRLTATQMNPATLQPVSENGPRLVIPSSTNGWNIGGTSPFTGTQQSFLIWAGNGTMNHNNATFYVDTDGNAWFRGDVAADNIIGVYQNVGTVEWFGSANPATPQVLTTFSLPAPRRSGELQTPVLSLSMNIQQVEPGNGEMNYSIDMFLNGGWTPIDVGSFNHGAGIGVNHAISVIGPPVSGAANFRFSISPGATNPHYLRVQGVRGFVMGVR